MPRRPIQFGGSPVRLTRAQQEVVARAGASPFGAAADAGGAAMPSTPATAQSAFPFMRVGLYSVAAYFILSHFIVPWWEGLAPQRNRG